MDVPNLVKEYCNPTNVNDLIKLTNLFEDLTYTDYEESLDVLVTETLNQNSANVGMVINRKIYKNAVDLLSELGLTINPDLEDITIKELLVLLNFQVMVEYISKEQAEYLLSGFEMYDDSIEAYSHSLASSSTMTFIRLYNIIDKLSLEYMSNLTKVLTDITTVEIEPVDYTLVKIIKLLKGDNNYSVLGLRNIRSGYDNDDLLMDYLKGNVDKLITQDINETALSIVSILILGTDSMFSITKSYKEVIEPLIDDELYKMKLYKLIEGLEVKTYRLYVKFNIKEENS